MRRMVEPEGWWNQLWRRVPRLPSVGDGGAAWTRCRGWWPVAGLELGSEAFFLAARAQQLGLSTLRWMTTGSAPVLPIRLRGHLQRRSICASKGTVTVLVPG